MLAAAVGSRRLQTHGQPGVLVGAGSQSQPDVVRSVAIPVMQVAAQGTGTSSLRVARGSELLPVLAAAVGGGLSSESDTGDAGSTGGAPSVGAVNDAVVRLASVLTGDDERARLGALRSLHSDSHTLCCALSGSGDESLCAELVRNVGSVLRAPCGQTSRRLAASLLIACGSSAEDGRDSSVLSLATWNWLLAPDAAEPGIAIVLEALPDVDLLQSLDAIAFRRAGRWRAMFSAASSAPVLSSSQMASPPPALECMSPQRWLAVLIRLCLACMGTPSHLTLLRSRFGEDSSALAEVLAGAALPHASRQKATAAASTAAGSVYDPQFGDVGAHAARLLALRLLAVPICGGQLTPDTLGQVVAVLRDASVEGASSVRIGIVGVAGLFGLATQILPRAKGAGRAAGTVISAIAAVVGQPTGPRWPEVARCYVLHALGQLLSQRSAALAAAAVVVPPLLGQFRVGYNLQSFDVLLHLVVHPRLGPNSALDILHWLEPLCLGDALHGRAATVPVLLLLDRFAGRRREDARQESQLANDPRYTSEATVRGSLLAQPEQRYRSFDDGWGGSTFLLHAKPSTHRAHPTVGVDADNCGPMSDDAGDTGVDKVAEKVLRCVGRLASAAVSAVEILGSGVTASGGQLDVNAMRQQGAWVRATLALELLNKLALLHDSAISAAVLEHTGELRSSSAMVHASDLVITGRHSQTAGVSMIAVQRALNIMERTCEADVLWSTEGDGGRWARKLSNQARSLSAQPVRSIGKLPDPMADRSVLSTNIRDGAVSAPPAAPQYPNSSEDNHVHGQAKEQAVHSSRDAVVSLPPIPGSASEEDSLEALCPSIFTAGNARLTDVSPHEPVFVESERCSQNRAHMSLEHRVNSTRSESMPVHLPQIAPTAGTSAQQNPTEAAGSVLNAGTSHHVGRFDRLIADLEQRSAAASKQVNDLKRRLERSVVELERRSAARRTVQQGGDPWRGVIEGRIRKLQRDMRGALAREHKARQALQLAATQQEQGGRVLNEEGVGEPSAKKKAGRFSSAMADERRFQLHDDDEYGTEDGGGGAGEDEYQKEQEEAEAYERDAEFIDAGGVPIVSAMHSLYQDEQDIEHECSTDEGANGAVDEMESDLYGGIRKDPLDIAVVRDRQLAQHGVELEHQIHDLDAVLQSELAAMAREASGDGDSLSFGSIHQLLMRSGVYSQEFSKADASSLFFAVLRKHQGAVRSSLRDDKGGRGQQMSSGRLPLAAVPLVLRRVARRIFANISENQAYEKLLSEHICAPDVMDGDDGGTDITHSGGDSTAERRGCRSMVANSVALRRPVTESERVPSGVGCEITQLNDSDRQADRDGLLREIFVAYCSFGDAMNMTELSLPKFIKLLQDCGVIDNRSVRRADVDIAFTSVLKGKGKHITSATFAEGLRLVAYRKYGVTRSSAAVPSAGAALEAFDRLLQEHILKHGRVTSSDLRPPSASGLKRDAVQELIRSNLSPLREIFRLGTLLQLRLLVFCHQHVFESLLERTVLIMQCSTVSYRLTYVATVFVTCAVLMPTIQLSASHFLV
eukprot:COSAG02_NODE_2672_length_8274_cov_3.014537_2_plen_1543_part_00